MKRNPKLVQTMVALAGIGLLIACDGPVEQRIEVVSLLEIEPIRLLREGFRESMDSYSQAHDLKFEYREYNANNDTTQLAQIVTTVAGRSPRVVYALGTPAAQAIQRNAPNLLLLQGACTDPVAAGLADSWERSGRQYIANSDKPSADAVMEAIVALLPTAKRVGVPYNPSEANSRSVVEELRQAAKGRGLAIEERLVSSATDFLPTQSALLATSDVIFLPPDNTVFAFIKPLVQAATDKGIPVISVTEDALESGALASFRVNYKLLGREAAELFQKVLQGSAPESMAIRKSTSAQCVVSQAVAAKLNVTIPPDRQRFDIQ